MNAETENAVVWPSLPHRKRREKKYISVVFICPVWQFQEINTFTPFGTLEFLCLCVFITCC